MCKCNIIMRSKRALKINANIASKEIMHIFIGTHACDSNPIVFTYSAIIFIIRHQEG